MIIKAKANAIIRKCLPQTDQQDILIMFGTLKA